MVGMRWGAVLGALGLAFGLSVPSASAAVPAKRLKVCSVVLPAELEPIFERTYRKGIADDAGACNYRKQDVPANLKKDDIVVSVIPERFGSPKRAKQAFAKQRSTVTELAGAPPEAVPVGDGAFYTLFIGTDLLTMRVGRVVVDVRVENNDDDQAVYHDQAIAVGQAIATRLATAP